MATHPVMVYPPGRAVRLYFTSDPPPSEISSGFVDAMAVRKNVFVHEQRCRLENEIDFDDARAFHWLVYASVSSRSEPKEGEELPADELQRRMSLGGNVPVGTLRLVPPPHLLHPAPGSVDGVGGEEGVQRVQGGDQATKFHDGREPYVKIGRMATVKAFRGLGLGKLMVNAALDWVAAHKQDVETLPEDPVERERYSKEKDTLEWKGLVMAHSQVTAVKFYESLGFEVDAELGKWIEEGIEHVAMWKRVELRDLPQKVRTG